MTSTLEAIRIVWSRLYLGLGITQQAFKNPLDANKQTSELKARAGSGFPMERVPTATQLPFFFGAVLGSQQN